MYACVCFCVTEEEVHEEIANGARSEKELGERCGAGTSCGTCVERLGCLLKESLVSAAVATTLEACPAPCAPALRRHGDVAVSA